MPLKTSLSNLGVSDDDQHIIWNSSEKSITVIKDKVNIFLKIDSKIAYINETPVTMDAEPILYNENGRVYIPVRFIAQSLGKKVVWDNKTKTIYISNESSYNSAGEILLRGSVFPSQFIESFNSDGMRISGLDGVESEVVIDKDNFNIKKFSFEAKGISFEVDKFTCNIIYNFSNSDFQ